MFHNKLNLNCICKQSRSDYIRSFLMNMEDFRKPLCHTTTMFCALLINVEWKQLGGGGSEAKQHIQQL